MRTSKDQYRTINGEQVLWNGYNYELQEWVYEGKKDTRTLEELQIAIKAGEKLQKKGEQYLNGKLWENPHEWTRVTANQVGEK